MFKDIENLKIKNIHKGITKKRGTVTFRENNSFVLLVSGCVRYSFSDYSIDVHPGEFVFMPRGSSYSLESLTDTPCEYISIVFSADITDPTPSLYPFDGFQDAEEFTVNLPDLWKFGGNAEHYKCYSVFYNLLAYVENLENMAYIDKKKISTITPAVDYLKKHIFDCDLNIEKLSRLCGISGTYFRQIFQSGYGTSPQKYILGKRLSHAKAIIDSGDFDTISEIAASVGYNDALYFSRAFKKKYGVSPLQYAKGQK